MVKWWSLSYWRLRRAWQRQRERLALMLWPYLDDNTRRIDDSEPLRLLDRIVRALESGRDEFSNNPDAQQLWQRASADNAIQQAAGAVRTLRLQLDGDTVASGLRVAPTDSAEIKRLRNNMLADDLHNFFGSWLTAPLTLPFFSVLFLFSGWLFNTLYLGKFGLPVGRYFGLSDYLAASIEGLLPVVVALLFTLVLQWIIRTRVRLQVLQNRLGLFWKSLFFGLAPLVIGLYGVPRLIPEPELQRLMTTYVVALVVPVLAIPLLLSFSRRPVRDSMLLNFLVIYAAVMWFIAEVRYVKLLAQDKSQSEVLLETNPDKPLPWRVISGNSLYLFLLNEEKELIAVPIEKVLSVRYKKNEPAKTEPPQSINEAVSSSPEVEHQN